MIIYGRMEMYYEQGMEHVAWVVTDPIIPGEYSLNITRPGDQLTVFGSNNELLWQGQISLDNPLIEFFRARRRAILESENIFNHPFYFDNVIECFAGFDQIIQCKLYKSALYGWIHWHVNNDFNGLAKQLGLSEDDALHMIGSPSDDEINNWKKRDYSSLPMNMSYFTRIGLLYNIGGHLTNRYGDENKVVQLWLHANHFDGKTIYEWLMSGEDGIKRAKDYTVKALKSG